MSGPWAKCKGRMAKAAPEERNRKWDGGTELRFDALPGRNLQVGLVAGRRGRRVGLLCRSCFALIPLLFRSPRERIGLEPA